MVNIKIKKLNNLAKIPSRGSEYAAGYDLYAATNYDIEISPHSTIKIGTGIAIEIPDGYFGGIYARSGIASKRGLRPANCVGILDSDYRGEVIVALHNDTDESMKVYEGERIAQLIVQPYQAITFEEVDELSETERADGSFGHSGSK